MPTVPGRGSLEADSHRQTDQERLGNKLQLTPERTERKHWELTLDWAQEGLEPEELGGAVGGSIIKSV